MPFCSQCGTQVAPEARFCNGCGRPMAAGATAAAPPMPAIVPLDYTIQGDNLQIARIRLRPGEQIYADAGRVEEHLWHRLLHAPEHRHRTRHLTERPAYNAGLSNER